MPNDWIDRALPAMSPAEWMVTTVILRQTIGWNKERDAISLSQFEQKTGLSRHTVIAAIRGLAQRGWIKVYEQGIRSVYEPCFAAGAISAPADTSAEIALPLVQKLHQTSAEIAPEVVQKLHTQKTSKDKTKTRKDKEVRARGARAQSEHADDPVSTPQTEKRGKTSTPRATLSAEEQARHRELFDAVASACVLDAKMNGGIIARTAKQLREGDPSAHGADVQAFLEWWKTSDFRGRQGSPPTPFQLVGSWRKFRENYAERPAARQTQAQKGMQATDVLSVLGGIYKEKNGNE